MPSIDEIDEHAFVRRAVPLVGGHELEVPAQLAGVGVDGEQGVRVQRVAGAARRRAPRRRLARREVHEIQLRVVARGVPRRAAERRPFVVLGPRLEAGLAFARRGVKRPEVRAVRGVVRLELAARREVAARRADEHFAVGDQRRVRVAFAGLVVAGLHFPALRARARIERDEEAVGRRKVDRVAVNGDAAVARIRLRRAMSCGYVRMCVQTSSPVTASNASTRPLPSAMYISPFATIGVATQRLLSRTVYAHTGRKRSTLRRLIPATG